MAEGRVPTPFGNIWVKWTIDSQDEWMVEVGRVQGKGRIVLPDGREEDIGPGERRWCMESERRRMQEKKAN
jgi:hypothetical protein